MEDRRTDEQKSADTIMAALNCLSTNESMIGELMANDHPTLQQSAMRMVVGFIKSMAAKTYTDPRNEASVELAKRLLAGIGGDNTYLPLI